MTYSDIHWKGRPHHHLPRIRVTTPRITDDNQITARKEAYEVIRRSWESPVQKGLKKLQFGSRFRHRRPRASRSVASVAGARRRASIRARQNLQIFGWDSSEAALASTATSQHNLVTGTPKASRQIAATTQDQRGATNTTTLISTDGAGSSVIKQAKRIRPKRGKSRSRESVDIGLKPLYRTSDDRLTRPTRSTTHVDPLEKSSGISNSRNSRFARKGGTGNDTYSYSEAQKISTQLKQPIPSKASGLRHGRASSKALAKKKPRSIGNAAFWDTLDTTILQAKTGGPTSTQVIKSAVESVVSDTASRTPSEKQAIKKFTKELELYLKTSKALPKLPPVLSPSATTVSAHTITELKPYHSELQAAGLAITSEEQKRGMAPGKSSKSQKQSVRPPTDGRYKSVELPGESVKRKGKSVIKKPQPASYASGSTGTTVMGFTPPHERCYDRPRSPVMRRHSSSDHTILGFTPPHEMLIQPVEPPPKTPSRKSLPWLRKLEPQINEIPVTKKGSKSTVQPENVIKEMMLPRSPPQASLSSYEMIAVASRTDKYNRPQAQEDPDYGTNKRLKQVQRSRQNTSHSHATTGSKQPNNGHKCVTRISCGHLHTVYSNMATQTEYLPEQSRKVSLTDEAIPSRAPLPSGLSRTFPLVNKKCSGDCQRLPAEPLVCAAPVAMRPSKVQWQQVDESIQAESNEFPLPERSPVVSSIGKAELRESSAFETVSDSLPASVPGKPRLSIQSAAPIREPPSPPRCTQCDCVIEHSTTPRMSKTDNVIQPQYEVSSDPRNGRSHRCTNRSSMQCQQYVPSRQTPTVSPLEALTPSLHEISVIDNPGEGSSPVRVESVTSSSNLHGAIFDDHLLESEDRLLCTDPSETEPAIDPVKRATLPKWKPQPSHVPQLTKRREYESRRPAAKAVPRVPRPPVLFTTAVPFDDFSSTITSLDTYAQQLGKVSNTRVFKGLQVATAAACDEDIDKWIEEVTGVGVKELLAELSRFDGLGINTLAGVAKRASKQRRTEAQGWEILRELRARDEAKKSSIIGYTNEDKGGKEHAVESPTDNSCNKARTRRDGQSRLSQEENLRQQMKYARECKGTEGVRGRATKMGWRERSVSGVEV